MEQEDDGGRPSSFFEQANPMTTSTPQASSSLTKAATPPEDPPPMRSPWQWQMRAGTEDERSLAPLYRFVLLVLVAAPLPFALLTIINPHQPLWEFLALSLFAPSQACMSLYLVSRLNGEMGRARAREGARRGSANPLVANSKPNIFVSRLHTDGSVISAIDLMINAVHSSWAVAFLSFGLDALHKTKTKTENGDGNDEAEEAEEAGFKARVSALLASKPTWNKVFSSSDKEKDRYSWAPVYRLAAFALTFVAPFYVVLAKTTTESVNFFFAKAFLPVHAACGALFGISDVRRRGYPLQSSCVGLWLALR